MPSTRPGPHGTSPSSSSNGRSRARRGNHPGTAYPRERATRRHAAGGARTATGHYTGDSAPARANRAILEEHLRAEIAGDLAGTMASMSAEPYLRLGSGTEARGREAVAEVYATRFRNVPDQHFDVERSVVTDDMAVIEGYVNATPQGTFYGMPAYGKRIRVPATVWIEFADGKLAGERGYYDTAELRRQLAEGAAD